MESLTTDQYQIINFYYHLLNTIEDGFDYVNKVSDNLGNTESDRIFSDILAAFNQIDSSNSFIIGCFENDKPLSEEVNKFDQVIKALEGLEQHFMNPDKRHSYIKNQLTPGFIAWKESVQEKLKIYITH
ncbi:hypothetical protein AB3Z07_24125 [Metabacillus halosaccharovorans]|uniref:hypothetical protein n=1 Tax=Bacillaceae TaxID=186817 RepID=UPI00047EC3BD|nr:hypothetical protein [Bacillus sp. J37]